MAGSLAVSGRYSDKVEVRVQLPVGLLNPQQKLGVFHCPERMDMDLDRFEIVPCPDGYDNCGVVHYRERETVLTDTDISLDRLPAFVHAHKTVRTDIGDDSEALPAYGGHTVWEDRDWKDANLITSKSEDFPWGEYHRPILDIDFEAELVPSSTPGHYHLYLDKLMTWDVYLELLEALAKAGVIQWGFYDGAKLRGATSARLPWIKKGDKKANMLDPDKENRELREERERLERRLAEINAQLAPVEDEDDDEVW